MRPMVVSSAVKVLRAKNKYYLTMKQRRLIADLLIHLEDEVRKATRPSVQAAKQTAHSDDVLVSNIESLLSAVNKDP